jgi:DNA primase
MSIVSYLEEVIDDRIKYTQNNQEVHFDCPICGDTRGRMYVNLSTHLVYCHNCNFSATFVKFIEELEGISYNAAVERYKEVKGSAYIPEDVLMELHNNLFIGDVSHNITKRAIPLPEEYVEMNFDNSRNPVMRNAIKYLMKRKISIRQMKQHGFGICTTGEYANRIIIPIKEFDDVKFFVARAIGSTVKGLKEKSPSNESYQISKSQVLFNIDHASAIFGSCVLSEGIFDALSFGDIGVSMLGKRMSDDQLAIILDYKEYLKNGVYIALDWDARKNALELAHQLYEYLPVYLIEMPKGNLEKGFDPNDYMRKFGKKAMYDLIDNAQEYDFSYHLKRKLFT